jgi:hypothetical protein
MMKKIFKLSGKILLGLIVLILAAMVLIPIIFKKQIKEVVVTQVNSMVNARVDIGDFSLGFFKNFPNLAFSLNDVSVSGVDQFEGDTLAAFNSFSVVFNLKSIFSDNGYEVKSIIVDNPRVKAVVLADGSANWDIMKESETEAAEVTADTSDEPSGEMKLLLRKFLVNNGTVVYNDASLNMSAVLEQLNFTLSGDLTETTTDLLLTLKIGGADVVYDGVRYLNNTVIDSKMNLYADLANMEFTFLDNFFSVNDLILNFAGSVSMPGEDIYTNLTFSTAQTAFKSLMSMIPAVYMTGYEGLWADGTFGMSGTVNGTYSETDSTLPDANININVRDGLISYPDLPEKISAIKVDLNIGFNGTDMDKTVVDLSAFHFEVAGNPFDMTMLLKSPVSDPYVKASAEGTIDFGSLAKAIPLEDMSITGILEASLDMAGRMSMIEEERYQDFHAAGTMAVSGFKVIMADMPEVTVSKAALSFNPQFADLTDCNILVGKNSDFRLNGQLANYIPYLFSDGVIKGSLNLNSSMVDADEIMASMGEDTEPEDTTALAIIVIPANIVVRDGMLRVYDTGMDMIGGKMAMNALYDTRDTLKPVMTADMSVTNILVKEAFTTFNTIQKLAPAADGIEGAVSMTLKFESLLGSDMMPVMNSLKGEGILTSDELQIVNSPTFEKIGNVLKLNDKYSNTFKDIRISFRVLDGRVYVTPFDTKMGNIKMNVSGDQGFDQTLNYFLKTEIPRAELGSAVNDLVDNLSAQASSLGLSYKPSDVIKVNLKVGGTATKPEISPDFGGSGSAGSSAISNLTEQAKEQVKEAVKETIDDAKAKANAEVQAQADKIMKEAETQAQNIRDEAARAAEKLKAEAEVQAQNLIKEAEGKNMLAKAAAAKGADVIRKEADKKAAQLIAQADVQAQKLLTEAAVKRDELLKK